MADLTDQATAALDMDAHQWEAAIRTEEVDVCR